MKPLRVLLFPIDMDRAVSFARYVKSLGAYVIAASSAMNEFRSPNVDEFVRIPFVTDGEFKDIFSQIIRDREITHVYAPHGAIWSRLYSLKREEPEEYAFHLCEPSPYLAEWYEFQDSYVWATDLLENNTGELLAEQAGVPLRPALTLAQYAGLHRQFKFIPGQCDDLKLQAFAQILRVAPKGDIVEIGSLYGRSSFALAWIASKYRVGSLISIDPWDNNAVEDQGEKAALINDEVKNGYARIDFKHVFAAYLASLSLLENVGYVKDISERAIRVYETACHEGSLETPEFGKVTLVGQVSLLHIDGNHRYDFVLKDTAAWEPKVMSGGWILLDDYVWAFGDGPKKVGDELLATGRFDVAFTMSDTLFLRKRP